MSCCKCNSCDRFIDTDYHPSAFVADGEVVLCEACMADPVTVLKALRRALTALQAQQKRAERTDNAYATSGRMGTHVLRVAALVANIKQAEGDFEKWLEEI